VLSLAHTITHLLSTQSATNGDSVIFVGSTRTTPSLDISYSVTGLTFDSSATSYTLGVANGSTLTLSGALA
jgi:hypothetical protein